MKKFVKNAALLLFVTLAFTACSSDDGGESTLSGVPSGEIVAVAERDQALTGASEGQGTQKWWTHVVSAFMFSSEDCGEDFEYENQGYYAFYPNGNYYTKSSLNGTPTLVGSWEWYNSSKSKIIISNDLGEAVNTLTYLNADNVVFGTKQNAEGCKVTTYEQFNNPF
jgi:hypothetical protein